MVSVLNGSDDALLVHSYDNSLDVVLVHRAAKLDSLVSQRSKELTHIL